MMGRFTQWELLKESVVYLLNEHQEQNIKMIKSLKLEIQKLEQSVSQLRDLGVKAETLDSLLFNVEFLTKELGEAYAKKYDERSLLTIPQLANLCGVDEMKIRRHINKGRLPQPLEIKKRYYYPSERFQYLKDEICRLIVNKR